MADTLPSEKRIARQKKFQAVTSLAGGSLGLAALATRGRSAQLSRRAAKLESNVWRAASDAPADTHVVLTRGKAKKLKDYSTALTTAGAGVGGVGAFNFASYTNAEAKRAIKKSEGGMEPFYGESFEQVEKAFNVAGMLRPLQSAGKHAGSFAPKSLIGGASGGAHALRPPKPVAAAAGRTPNPAARVNTVGSATPKPAAPSVNPRPAARVEAHLGPSTPRTGGAHRGEGGFKMPSLTGGQKVGLGIGGAAAGGTAVGFYGGNRRNKY